MATNHNSIAADSLDSITEQLRGTRTRSGIAHHDTREGGSFKHAWHVLELDAASTSAACYIVDEFIESRESSIFRHLTRRHILLRKSMGRVSTMF